MSILNAFCGRRYSSDSPKATRVARPTRKKTKTLGKLVAAALMFLFADPGNIWAEAQESCSDE